MSTQTLSFSTTNRENVGFNANILSDHVIPAVPGEYYSYSSEFSDRKPVYVFMKCKANKNRPTEDLPDLGDEANLLFIFSPNKGISVCPIREASDLGIVDETVQQALVHETFITETDLSEADFYRIRSARSGWVLKDVCIANIRKRRKFIVLRTGLVISIMTSGGKYGLFLVTDVDTASIKVDACHILF